MELSTSGDDVFSSFFGGNDHKGIGLCEFFESIYEFGEVGGVFGSDGDSDDGGDGVLHGSDAVGIDVIGDGTGLEEVLVDTNESDGITARDVGDVLDGSAHHENGSLDGLFVKVSLAAGLVVGSHDSDFLSGGDSSGEYSSEGEESRLVGGGYHLGHVHH